MRYIFIFFIFISPANAGWFSYDNYDDCMLGKMKGQNQSAYLFADKECKRQFKVEFLLHAPDIKWDFESVHGNTIVTLTNESEYAVTSGEFLFSQKPCAESKPSDFRAASISFNNGVGVYSWGIQGNLCAKIVRFKGRYK